MSSIRQRPTAAHATPTSSTNASGGGASHATGAASAGATGTGTGTTPLSTPRRDRTRISLPPPPRLPGEDYRTSAASSVSSYSHSSVAGGGGSGTSSSWYQHYLPQYPSAAGSHPTVQHQRYPQQQQQQQRIHQPSHQSSNHPQSQSQPPQQYYEQQPDDDSQQKEQQSLYHHQGRIRTARHLRAEQTRLEDYHVAYRVPLHVPDHQYRAYLLGRNQTQSSQQALQQQRIQCCARTCIGFSTVAVLFLWFIAFLIQSQPILMAGTLPTAKGLAKDGSGKIVDKYLLPTIQLQQDQDNGNDSSGTFVVLETAQTAYHAAYAYLVCIALSLAALHPYWIQSQIYRLRYRYQNIPDHMFGGGTTGSGTGTGTTGTGAGGSGGTTMNGGGGSGHSLYSPATHEGNTAATPPGWTRTLWNRCNFVVRQRLTEIGWYQPRRSRRRSMRREE